MDEHKLQLIIDAEKQIGRQVRVQFNYRYSAHHTKIRELIASGVIGEVSSVHMDWKGYRVASNGSKGRMEVNLVEEGYAAVTNHKPAQHGDENHKDQGGHEHISIVVKPLFGKRYEVPVEHAVGGHGGGDPVLLRDVLVSDQSDKFKQAAFLRDGGNAVLVGVGINRSMKWAQAVKIQELVSW